MSRHRDHLPRDAEATNKKVDPKARGMDDDLAKDVAHMQGEVAKLNAKIARQGDQKGRQR